MNNSVKDTFSVNARTRISYGFKLIGILLKSRSISLVSNNFSVLFILFFFLLGNRLPPRFFLLSLLFAGSPEGNSKELA